MANHKSAVKEHRRSLENRVRNRVRRSRLRSAVKRFRAAIDAGDLVTAKSLLPSTLSLLDQTAKSRAIHPNTADRAKSRLARALNRIATA